MDRDRRYRRCQRRAHIKRKVRLLKSIDWLMKPKCIGKLSKGKIHCSCPLCTAKYKRLPSITDERKIQNYESQLEDFSRQ